MPNWPQRFLDLAAKIASWSKDPRTQVGAIALADGKIIVETGFNGPPMGVLDLPERLQPPLKYLYTSHAEENLVAFAARPRLSGTTVVVTHLCCARCARSLINAGVAKVICGPGKTNMPEEEFTAAVQMLEEAGVELVKTQAFA